MKVQNVYYRTMGRLFTVTAICQSEAEANRYMLDHPREGVVAVFGHTALLAAMDDAGAKLAAEELAQSLSGTSAVMHGKTTTIEGEKP